MQQWSQGYVVDVPYIYHFQPNCSPNHLRFTAVLNGFAPPPERGFTYLELGSGQGYSTNVFASLYPDSEFYAVDFLESHNEAGRAFAEQAGLSNVHFVCKSFADLLEDDEGMPQMDYIVMHGVYAWVDDLNRRILLDIVAKKLKPGGVVFVSYNTLPGCSYMWPYQKFLTEYARHHTEGTSSEQVMDGLRIIDFLIGRDVSFFTRNPELKGFIKELMTHDPRYLSHEFMNLEWRPFTSAEISRDFSRAGADFIGIASLSTDTDLPDEIAFLTGGRPLQHPWSQTIRDFAYGAQFRSDVMQREPRRLPRAEADAMLDRERLTTRAIVKEMTFQPLPPPGRPGLDAAAFATMMEVLDAGCPTFRELVDRLGAERETVVHYLRQLIGQTSVSSAMPYEVDPAPARRLNEVVFADDPIGSRYAVFASPVLGNGVKFTPQIMLLRQVVREQGELAPHRLAEEMEAYLARTGRTLPGSVQDEVEMRTEFARLGQRAGPRVLPLLRKLDVL